MSTPTEPTRDPVPSGFGELRFPEDDPARGRWPWGWIAGCVVLVLVAGGFAVWALGLQSDLDDQKDQTQQAQQEADQAKQTASDASDAMNDLSGQIDEISQGIDDAGNALDQAGEDAKDDAQSALDGLKGRLSTLKDQAAEGSATPVAEEPAEAQPTATP